MTIAARSILPALLFLASSLALAQMPPSLVSPAQGDTGVPTATTLDWSDAAGASVYHCQLSDDSTFAGTFLDDSLVSGTTRMIDGLSVSTRYYWRVRSGNGASYGGWSVRRSFLTAATPTTRVRVRSAWNLVSIPSRTIDPRVSVQFPDAVSQAYRFDPSGGYQAEDTLVPGAGYWLKFADSAAVPVTGAPVTRDTVILVAGWNLVGAIAVAQPTALVQTLPSGILSSAFFAYASGYAEATTLLPGQAYWVKAAAPGILILSSSAAMAVTHTGEATYYTFADGSGNCMFPATPEDLMVGAMNQTDYDNSNICGSCATITGPDGTIDVRIVDRCPECAPGDIDLSPEAFALIARIELGRVPISWHLRPCPVTGPIEYHFKDGANQWWTAVQIRNHRNPIATFEYQVSPGLWKEVPRVSYNYFVEGAGMGPGPYTFRVTDIFGNILTDTGIPLVPDGSVTGTGQFP
jgi:expansin (peptidoglycan-binding protein)